MQQNYNFRKLDKTEIGNILFNSQTEILITKQTLDNVCLTDTRYYLDSLNERIATIYTEHKEKHIFVSSSKLSENSQKTKLDLYKQSHISKILSNIFKLYISNINLLDFESSTGDVCTIIEKDTNYKKHFTLSAFTKLEESNKDCLEYRIRTQTLYLNDLNITPYNPNYLDFVFVRASEYKEVASMLKNNKIRLNLNSILVVEYANNEYRFITFKETIKNGELVKGAYEFNDYQGFKEVVSTLDTKDFIRESNSFNDFYKPYLAKQEDKKHNTNNIQGVGEIG